MITVDYISPWEGRWNADPQNQAWMRKAFTYVDFSDLFHKQRFGYFPQYCVLDCVEYRITHGQVIQLTAEAQANGAPIQINDQFSRYHIDTGSVPDNHLPEISLREYQRLVTQIAADKGHGIVQIGTGGGKTVIMGSLVKYLLNSECQGLMILIYSKTLLNQTAKRFISYGIDPDDIGIIHSEISPKKQVEASKKLLVLSTHRSIVKFNQTIERCEYILCDEAHQTIGPMWSALFGILPNLKNVIGFTATPWEDDSEKFKMLSIFGQILCDIPCDYLMRNGWLMTPESYFIRLTYEDRDRETIAGMDHNQAKKQFIIEDKNRNLLPIAALKKFGGRMMVLYETIKHGKHLQSLYKAEGYETRLADGSSSEKKRQEAVNWFAEPLKPNETGKVLLGSRIFDEGLDLDNGCDILFIIAAGKKGRRNKQRVGRSLRKNTSGRLMIFDVWDGNHKTLARWSGHRKKAQEDLGIKPKTISLEEFRKLT